MSQMVSGQDYQTLKPVIGGHLADWITLFEHGQKDNTKQNVEYAPVQQALDRLKGLSADADIHGQCGGLKH